MRRAAILKSPVKVPALNVWCAVERYSDAFLGRPGRCIRRRLLDAAELFRNPVLNEMIILAEFRIDDAVHIFGGSRRNEVRLARHRPRLYNNFSSLTATMSVAKQFLVNMEQFRDHLSQARLREMTEGVA
jgi:hypothetical protein